MINCNLSIMILILSLEVDSWRSCLVLYINRPRLNKTHINRLQTRRIQASWPWLRLAHTKPRVGSYLSEAHTKIAHTQLVTFFS